MKKPFWIAWNAGISVIILAGGFLLGTLVHARPEVQTYCAYKTCVRYWPPEDKQDAMLQQIVALRHSR